MKILEALFGPSIPTEKAGLLPEIMDHIKAIDDLLQGKPSQRARPRIYDPAISGPINSRIVELYTELGPAWADISKAIAKEFQEVISPGAVKQRYKGQAAVREGYAALSGSAHQKIRAEPGLVRDEPNPREDPPEYVIPISDLPEHITHPAATIWESNRQEAYTAKTLMRLAAKGTTGDLDSPKCSQTLEDHL